MEQETYTIFRLETWDDNTWEYIIEAIEDTVASFGEDGEG